MSFGKMNTFIDIISTVPIKDEEGFATKGDNILASVLAYKEDRHGSERMDEYGIIFICNFPIQV
ncbi:hypothetical protein [Paenibacillus glucanolyticus]|uniref:hypothetical protein n=1 Tax=Paenibacillus glucanolyticus TaxID=59843 RepID=UPI0020B12C9D|nr:hypothetical protein [Paenibacillus glucanolyticus]